MPPHTQFDYLIVGAGSAGAILAARLSEDPHRRVLLLEAGPEYRAASAPPEMHSANADGIMDAQRFPTYHWLNILGRRTARQEPYPYIRGRGLGGSSAVNAQMAHRAPLEDFDWWAEQGCVGWSGEELLPAMIRLETDLDFGDAPYHGRSGPVPMYRLPIPQWGQVDLALLHAALDLGYPWHADLNAPDSTGVCACPVNRTATGRVSTNDAYLEPARGRPNLTIRGDSHVDRVLFDGRRAIGVRAHGHDGWSEFTGQEVILSAGAVMSPAILMRSGIGPAAQQRALGLPVLADLPVGRNLRDHATIWFTLALRPAARARSPDERNINCIIRYSSGLAGASANDMLVISVNQGGYGPAELASGLLSLSTWQVFSEGSLRLVDRDPFMPPWIDGQLLSDERDLIRMRDGTRRLLTIVRHPALQAISHGISLAPILPGAIEPTLDALNDDTALDHWLQATVTDLYHATGTCRMGAPDDPRTVVSPTCHVLGVEGLRVIDGSIMPNITRSNTNLPIMAIAEHMAAQLRREG